MNVGYLFFSLGTTLAEERRESAVVDATDPTLRNFRPGGTVSLILSGGCEAVDCVLRGFWE